MSEKKIKNKLVLVGRNATSKKQNLDEMINKMVSDKLISYFEFFPGDFIVFGILGAIVWMKQAKEDEDFR